MNASDNNSNGSNARDSGSRGDLETRAELSRARLTRDLTAELNSAVAAIDTSTATRLASARRAALGQSSSIRTIHFRGTPWATATVGLAAVVLVVLLWLEPLKKGPDLFVTNSSQSTLESLSILSAIEGLHFFRSVEFLIWMEKNSG